MSEDLWSERAKGREKLESTFSRSSSSSSLKLLSLGLSTCLSEMLEAVETEKFTHREHCVNEGPVKMHDLTTLLLRDYEAFP